MTIILGSDHAGFALRRILADHLVAAGYAVSEVGATSEGAYDYPIAAQDVATRLLRGEADLGVLVCGTGIGMAIAANRFRGIRAADCWSPEVARLAREHNHANVLCLGGRLIAPDDAIRILDAFLATGPSPEPRHGRRVGQLDEFGECIEHGATYCK